MKFSGLLILLILTPVLCTNISAPAVVKMRMHINCIDQSNNESKFYCKRNMTSLPNDLSQSFEQIVIYGTNISEIKYGFLNDLTECKDVKLPGNAISVIEPRAFYGMIKLKTLNLRQNDISNLKNGTFFGLGNLRQLKLTTNKLYHLRNYMFRDLNDILYLLLGDNRINKIENGTFEFNKKLRLLNLQGNNLKEIDKDWTQTFTSVFAISRLNLSQNNITTIKGGHFCKQCKITRLFLEGNNLSCLKKQSFDGIKCINNLYLSNNVIENVEQQAFLGLSTLKRLDLSCNKLTTIYNWTFEGLDSLTDINLTMNKISIIHRSAFAHTNLINIFLKRNNLVSLTWDVLVNGGWGMIKPVFGRNLVKILELHGNNLLWTNATCWMQTAIKEGWLILSNSSLAENSWTNCLSDGKEVNDLRYKGLLFPEPYFHFHKPYIPDFCVHNPNFPHPCFPHRCVSKATFSTDAILSLYGVRESRSLPKS